MVQFIFLLLDTTLPHVCNKYCEICVFAVLFQTQVGELLGDNDE